MTLSTLFDRLRPGRDPNDTSWLILRRQADWRAGDATGLGYDAATGSLELAPLPRPELAATWLANAPVSGADGTAYRVDTEGDMLWCKDTCDTDWRPVSGFGGTGFATGRLDTPVSVVLDAQGRLWVADAGNARVQVVDPKDGTVIATLTEGLVRPVHVTFDAAGTVYVTDAVTRAIHVFASRFAALRRLALATRDAWSDEVWVAPPDAEPRAASVLADQTLVVFDPTRPGLWHMTARGRALPSLPWFNATGLPPGWMPTPARFAAEGEVVVGPLDSGTLNFAWHRILVEADLPQGCHITAQTYADNATRPDALAWAPKAPVAMPKAAADRPGADLDRLVLANEDQWPLWRLGRMIRAKPDLMIFAGDGPNGTDQATVPFAVAQRLHPGDLVRLTTPGGGSTEVTLTAMSPQPVSIAAQGRAEDFTKPTSITLLSRNGMALPYGPLDLGFLSDPATVALAALVRSAKPEEAMLPAPLAAFLTAGDILAVGGGARLEILGVGDADVVLSFDRAVEGDFSVATLALVDSVGRLIVADPLPELGPLPPGLAASVIDDVRREGHVVAWIDGSTGTIWLVAPMATAITAASWTNVQFDTPRASDQGRQIWLRLRLSGTPFDQAGQIGPAAVATATPRLRSVRLTGPRPSLTALLPALFSRRDPQAEPPGANFLERFLTLFEGQFTRVEEAYESVSRLLNPRSADPEWIAFTAAWLDLWLDPSWPLERRRQLVIEGAALQAGRGTPRAMIRWLEIYTGAPVAITEGFRMRPPAPITLGGRGALGIAPLGGESAGLTDRFAHRFTVSVTLPAASDRPSAKAAVRNIIEAMKPAHTAYVLASGSTQTARIGIDTVVDAIFIPAATRELACLCDSNKTGADRPETGQVPGGFRLGGRLGRGPVTELGLNGG